jgi:YbbR domain-containing protein
MRKILTRNIGWKILSLFFAILLWLLIINIEDPQTPREVREVAVEIRYSDLKL